MAAQWDSQVDVSIDKDFIIKFKDNLEELQKGLGIKAMVRGMNVAVSKMKTESKAPVKKRYVLRQITKYSKYLVKNNATYARPTAEMKADDARPIPIAYYKIKPGPTPGVKGTKPAWGQALKGSGGGYIKGAFVTGVKWVGKDGSSGIHKGVFVRDTKSEKYDGRRYPIKQVHAPAGAEFLNQDEIKEAVSTVGEEAFEKEYLRQVDFLMTTLKS